MFYCASAFVLYTCERDIFKAKNLNNFGQNYFMFLIDASRSTVLENLT
jgi:hypothetical protein